jgi:hypothetical protein
VSDQQRAVSLSLDGLQATGTPERDCDIAMSSDALHGFLSGLWGGMTLIVSGRFQTRYGGDYLVQGGVPPAIRRYVALADDANHGWPLREELRLRARNKLPWLKPIDLLYRHIPREARLPTT